MSLDPSTPILVVDQQAHSVTFILDALSASGYEDVEVAASGTAGLDLLRDSGLRLVLAELHMAPVSGLELLRVVRSDRDLSVTPSVMTAHSVTAHEAIAVKQGGADSLLLKPFTAAALASKIHAAIAARKSELAARNKVDPQSKSFSLGRRLDRRWMR